MSGSDSHAVHPPAAGPFEHVSQARAGGRPGVIVPTTHEPITIESLKRRRRLPASYVALKGDFRPLQISSDYDRFVRGPLQAVLGELVSFELVLDGDIDCGRSWELPVLIAHFLQKFSPNPNPDLQPEARLALLSYGWPGNVRELENAIQRAALLTRQSQISLQDLPDEIHPDSPQQKKPLSLEELEKRQIDYVLSITESVSEASQILGIDPATLWRKRKKYGLAD